jgi:hypothetical protein
MFTLIGDRLLRLLPVACLATAALFVSAVPSASAAVSPGGSTFTGGAEGWSGSSTCDISATLLCETSAGYDGSAGDPAGSLDVKTQVLLNALALFHVTATEESPGFTATESGAATLRVERQFEPGGLLPLTPRATYTVTLLDHSTGTREQAIDETISEASGFTARSGSVSLTAGHSYSVLISAGVESTVASVGLTGTSDLRFDNVSVTGSGSGGGGNGSGGGSGDGSGGGANGGNGAGGSNGGNGSGGVSSAQLESMIKGSTLVGAASLKGNRLSVKAKCPAKFRATCTISLQGMLSRHKPATVGRRAKVKKSKTKGFALTVKPAARRAVGSKKKLLFKETVKVGKAKATAWKTLKLVRK